MFSDLIEWNIDYFAKFYIITYWYSMKRQIYYFRNGIEYNHLLSLFYYLLFYNKLIIIIIITQLNCI